MAKRILKIFVGLALLALAGLLLIKQPDVNGIIEAGGIFGLALTVFAETGLLIGFFLPGDTLLFAAGFFASQDKINLIGAILGMLVGAILGNMIGYEIGKRGGPRMFNKQDSLLFHKDNVLRAEAFFDKHGGKAVILARFVPVVRTLSSPIAGIAKMDYSKFMLYNVIGALLWVPTVTLVGLWAGNVLGKYIDIEKYILPIILLATFSTFGVSFLHLLRDETRRTQIKNKLKPSNWFKKPHNLE